MVKLAINKAEKSTGREFRDKNIVIIGDSVRDIECGKLFSALTIAVATGFHSEEELLKVEPDYLFDNLKDYRKVLKAIG
jgi:phosphoglycolate phosphatase-like HAD superfamily hydrolase